MPSTNRGTAVLKFGPWTIAGKIVNESDTGITGQKVIEANEDGQNVIHISNFGLEGEHSITVIPLAAVPTKPAIDSVINYNGQSGVLRAFNEVAVKRQVVLWRMVIDFIPGITYGA